MKDKVISVLNMPKDEESIRMLCDLCGVRDFQASDIIDEFKSLQSSQSDMIQSGGDASYINSQMQAILRKLISGEYSKEEVIKEDYKRKVISLLSLPISDESVENLSKLVKRDYDVCKDMISKYVQAQMEETELLKNGMDASSKSAEKWAIINELSDLN